MVFIKGIRLGPEEIIKMSLESWPLKLIKFLEYFIKLQLLINHFFSKYCLVIKRVFARKREALIAFHTFISASVKTCEEAFQGTKYVVRSSSSVKILSR